MKRQNFITLEGGEGTGKTTTAKLLKETLEKKGYNVILTREPGGSLIGEQIRNIIFENEIDIEEEALLFAAARVDHINKVIIPNLNKNNIVICDRYVHSSIVYQQYVGGCQNVKSYNKYAFDNCMPEKTFFFDIEPIQALQRISKNKREENRFDKKSIDFHNNIYKAYKTIAKDYADDIITIDASLTSELIVEKIIKEMNL